MLKDFGTRILGLVFLANFFFEENREYLLKRAVYSVFIYAAIYELVRCYQTRRSRQGAIPIRAVPGYVIVSGIFVAVTLVTDALSPSFNLITLINNPFALLAIGPVALFAIGANETDLRRLHHFMAAVAAVFVASWALELPGRVPYYQSSIAVHALIPLCILSFWRRKQRAVAVALLVAAIAYAFASDQRIIILRVVLFVALSAAVALFRGSRVARVLVIVGAAAFLAMALTSLGPLLNAMAEYGAGPSFDTNDTRTFLYSEIFHDLSPLELFRGRGFLGTYYSEYFYELSPDRDEIADFYHRFSSEVGFLHLLLKGGLVYYLLYTAPLWYVSLKAVLTLPATRVAVYLSTYLLTELLLMFIGNQPYFGFQWSLMFLCAGITYRMMYLARHRQPHMALR